MKLRITALLLCLACALAFGACGEGFVRISYAYSLENLKLAMERLNRFVGHLREWQKK